jgi:hypothetical protein
LSCKWHLPSLLLLLLLDTLPQLCFWQLSLLPLLLLLLLLQVASAITAAAPAAWHSAVCPAAFTAAAAAPSAASGMYHSGPNPAIFLAASLKSGCRTSNASDSVQHLLCVLRLWLPLLLLPLLCMASVITALSAAHAALDLGKPLLCFLQLLLLLPLLLLLLQVACTTQVQSLPFS